MLPSGAPSAEMLATRSNLVSVIPLVRSHVVILSQSCDAEDVERKCVGRILVAPVIADDDERFRATYEEATKDASDAFARKLTSVALKGHQPTEAAMDKGKSTLENPRKRALEGLWLGRAVGAFPLAANEDAQLSRSICYFDNVVSLPFTWIPILRERRVLRLSVDWASVLREGLGSWVGRFAFPSSNEDRLRAGGEDLVPSPSK